MIYNKIVIAAFMALLHSVSAAPVEIDARTQRTAPVWKNNDGNTFVSGTAKGGDGGSNSANNYGYAAPVVVTWGKNTGHIYQPVTQSNEAYQYADGGSAAVIGNKGRDLDERTDRTYPVVKGNDRNTFVVGTAKGGNGGSNSADNWSIAKPKIFSGGKNFGTIDNSVEQSNTAYQSADGGDAIVAGNYRAPQARDLEVFETRHLTEELEARGFTFPSYFDNDHNTFVSGTAIGGKGGSNSANNYQAAKPVVISGGRNKGTIKNGVTQQNYAEQYADGGGAAVIANQARDLYERTGSGCSCDQPSLIATGPVLSGNDRNTFVKGDATGGKGGTNNANNVNTAIPVVVSTGKNGGKIQNGVNQSNYAEQYADGGSAMVVGNSRG